MNNLPARTDDLGQTLLMVHRAAKQARKARMLLEDNQRLLRENAALRRNATGWWLTAVSVAMVSVTLLCAGTLAGVVYRDIHERQIAEIEQRQVNPDAAQFIRAVEDLRRRAEKETER